MPLSECKAGNKICFVFVENISYNCPVSSDGISKRANSFGILCKRYMQSAEVVQYRSRRDMLSINADYKIEKGQYFRKAKHSEWLLRITLLSLSGGELLMHIYCTT